MKPQAAFNAYKLNWIDNDIVKGNPFNLDVQIQFSSLEWVYEHLYQAFTAITHISLFVSVRCPAIVHLSKTINVYKATLYSIPFVLKWNQLRLDPWCMCECASRVSQMVFSLGLCVLVSETAEFSLVFKMALVLSWITKTEERTWGNKKGHCSEMDAEFHIKVKEREKTVNKSFSIEAPSLLPSEFI